MKRSALKRRKPLKSGTPLKRVAKLKARPVPKAFAKRRDPQYAAWIRTHPCCIAVGYHWFPSFTVGGGTVQAAHVKSRGAGGDDHANLLPLCGDHHAEQHRIGVKTFAEKYGLDLQAEAARLYEAYQRETGAP